MKLIPDVNCRTSVAPKPGKIWGIDERQQQAHYPRMAHTVWRSLVLALIAAALAAGAGGCGSPADDDGKEFVFTPVAYTVVTSAEGTPQAVARDAAGARFVAEDVLITVEIGAVNDFKRDASDLGFTVRFQGRDEQRGYEAFVVGVPPGAGVAAQQFFVNRDGVVDASLNYFFEGG